MKFSTSLVRFGSVGDLALELKKALTAIAAGWNVEHNPDGTHKAITVSTITERGRSAAIGAWTDFPPVLSADVGTATITSPLTNRVTLLGDVAVVTFFLGITITGTPNHLLLALPAGLVAANYSANVAMDGAGSAVLILTVPGATQFSLYRNTFATGTWPTGGNTIGGTATFPIQ